MPCMYKTYIYTYIHKNTFSYTLISKCVTMGGDLKGILNRFWKWFLHLLEGSNA